MNEPNIRAVAKIPKRDVIRVPSGFTTLDAMLGGGIVLPSLGVIPARPNVGKTRFGLSLLRQLQCPRMFISMEENAEDVREMLEAAEGSLSKIMVADLVTTCDIDSVLESLDFAAKWHMPIVVLDHLQCIEVPRCRPFSYEAASMAIRALQKWVKGGGHEPVCLIALAQIGRGVMDKGAYREPMMEDIKGSGEIEQAADWIVSLWREEAFKDDSGPVDTRIKLTVLKNRRGLRFVRGYMGFDGAQSRVWDLPEPEITSLQARREARAERQAEDSSPGAAEATQWLSD
jgi:replicative DNA helicase